MKAGTAYAVAIGREPVQAVCLDADLPDALVAVKTAGTGELWNVPARAVLTTWDEYANGQRRRLGAAAAEQYEADRRQLDESLAATGVADRLAGLLDIPSPRIMRIDGEFQIVIPVRQLNAEQPVATAAA